MPDFEERWTGPEESHTGAWLEVKGKAPTGREVGLCYDLASSSGFPVILVSGLPKVPKGDGVWGYWPIYDLKTWRFDLDGEIESDLKWLRCCKCGTVQLGKTDLYCCSLHDPDSGAEIPSANGDKVISDAFRKMRAARFEHGEKG